MRAFPFLIVIALAIESLAGTKVLDARAMRSHRGRQNTYTCVGFFAEVFAANPERVTEWRKLIDRPGQDGDTQYWLRKALAWGRPASVPAPGKDKWSRLTDVEETYLVLGAFFASGNAAYVRKLANQLALVDDADPQLFNAGAETMVLLASNVPQHPLLRQALEAAREEVRPRIRELIDDLLTKDYAAVLQQLRDLDRSPLHSGNTDNNFRWRRPLPPTGPHPYLP